MESLLAAGYALFLCAGRARARCPGEAFPPPRSELYRNAGFSYDAQLDAWECPEGEQLHRIETDHQVRLVRYRARAHVCNSCPRKADCTDSDSRPGAHRALDPWPHSEVGRFHRGIAVAIVAFGVRCSGRGGASSRPRGPARPGRRLLISTLSASTCSRTSALRRAASRGRTASAAGRRRSPSAGALGLVDALSQRLQLVGARAAPRSSGRGRAPRDGRGRSAARPAH